jgi:hypothetical protein
VYKYWLPVKTEVYVLAIADERMGKVALTRERREWGWRKVDQQSYI